MKDNTDDNQILDDTNEPDQLEFQYNFINTPWDDRSPRSKIAIVMLLASIFLITMSLVALNFYMHYRGFSSVKSLKNEISCFRVRADELSYVARLHSVTTKELLCLGAVISPTSVLANGVCVRFGQLRMFIGAPFPRCKQGFSVDVSESIRHPGVFSNRLVLLSSYENIGKCSKPITIGHELNWDWPVDVIGRPFVTSSFLSKQQVSLAKKDVINTRRTSANVNNDNYTIVVMGIGRCPVRSGDLMVQNGKLFGLAAYQHNKVAFFAALDPVKSELKELDVDINIESFKYRFYNN